MIQYFAKEREKMECFTIKFSKFTHGLFFDHQDRPVVRYSSSLSLLSFGSHKTVVDINPESVFCSKV